MPRFQCRIHRDGAVVFRDETTAPTVARACSNIWFKFALSRVSEARAKLFIANQKADGYECACDVEGKKPSPAAVPRAEGPRQLRLF